MHQSQHARLHTGQRGIPSCPKCVSTSGKGGPEVNYCEELKPYWSRWLELSIHYGCLLWGEKVMVPSRGRFHAGRVARWAPGSVEDESTDKG